MPQDVEDTWRAGETIEDVSVCEVDTKLSAGAFGALLSAGVVSMEDWGFPLKQMPDERRAIMQTLRLSGPATPFVMVPPVNCVQANWYQGEISCSGAVHYRSEESSTFAFTWRGGWAKRP